MTRTFALAALAFMVLTASFAPRSVHAQSPVPAKQVQALWWGQNFLSYQGNGVWEERKNSGATFFASFNEVYFNDRELIVNDPSRDVNLRVRFDRMMLEYSEGNSGAYRDLHRITHVTDTNGTTHKVNQKTNSARAVEPDLNILWNSDFGPIDWVQGYYSERSKRIKGQLSWNGKNYVYAGQWYRSNNNRQGRLVFTFAPDGRSFTGWYESGGQQKPWNGRR